MSRNQRLARTYVHRYSSIGMSTVGRRELQVLLRMRSIHVVNQSTLSDMSIVHVERWPTLSTLLDLSTMCQRRQRTLRSMSRVSSTRSMSNTDCSTARTCVRADRSTMKQRQRIEHRRECRSSFSFCPDVFIFIIVLIVLFNVTGR
jgi:hypothetical protein